MNQSFWSKTGSVVKMHQMCAAEKLSKETAMADVAIEKIESEPEVFESVIENHSGFEIEVKKPVNRESVLTPLRAEKEKVTQHSSKLASWKASAVAFAAELAAKGIASQAILPRTLFNELCSRFGIYRFENLVGGRTRVHAEPVLIPAIAYSNFLYARSMFLIVAITIIIVSIVTKEMDALMYGVASLALLLSITVCTLFDVWSKKPGVRWKREIIGWALGFASIGAWGHFIARIGFALGEPRLNHPVAMIINGILGMGLFLLTLASLSVKDSYQQWATEKVSKLTGRLALRMSHARLLKCFFPDFVDANSGNGAVISVRFPHAPQYFIEALLKLEKSDRKVMIAATPEAITLDRDEIKTVAENATRELFSKLEPVLYCVENDLVAVVSSFGEFPNEEEMLRWVEAEGMKLCFN